jgi:hypothetical protein
MEGRKKPRIRKLCPKPSSEKGDSIQGQSRQRSETSRHNAQINLTSNGDGTYNVQVTAKNLKVRTRKQGKVLFLLNIDEDVPVEVRVGNLAFNPKLVMKMHRSITKRDRFLIEREFAKSQINPHIV